MTESRERRVTCQQLIGNVKHMKNYRIFQWKSSYNTTVSDMLKDGK